MIDAALEAHFAWDRFKNATTPIDAAYALTDLNNAMDSLVTWLPGYNYETGEIDDDPNP